MYAQYSCLPMLKNAFVQECNDNLLDSAHTEYRQISTGEVEVGLGEFVTDLGLVVSAVSVKLREQLNDVIANHRQELDNHCKVREKIAK